MLSKNAKSSADLAFFLARKNKNIHKKQMLKHNSELRLA